MIASTQSHPTSSSSRLLPRHTPHQPHGSCSKHHLLRHRRQNWTCCSLGAEFPPQQSRARTLSTPPRSPAHPSPVSNNLSWIHRQAHASSIQQAAKFLMLMAIPISITPLLLRKEEALSQLPWMSAPLAIQNFSLVLIAVGVLFLPLLSAMRKYASLCLKAKRNPQTLTLTQPAARPHFPHNSSTLLLRLEKLAAGSRQVLRSPNATLPTDGMRRVNRGPRQALTPRHMTVTRRLKASKSHRLVHTTVSLNRNRTTPLLQAARFLFQSTRLVIKMLMRTLDLSRNAPTVVASSTRRRSRST